MGERENVREKKREGEGEWSSTKIRVSFKFAHFFFAYKTLSLSFSTSYFLHDLIMSKRDHDYFKIISNFSSKKTH